jgi:hypothetical protein
MVSVDTLSRDTIPLRICGGNLLIIMFSANKSTLNNSEKLNFTVVIV